MVKEEACGWCGEWFVKQHHNQCYCSKECGRLADKEKDRLRRRKKANKETKTQGIPSLSIHDMVDLMMKTEKEQGKVVSYGDIQTMLYTGKLKGGADNER